MNLLMISGDRSILQGRKGAFWYTLEEFSKHWERVDVICPKARGQRAMVLFGNVHFHPSSHSLWYQPFWILTKGKELIAAHRHGVMTVHEYPPFYNGLGAWLLHRMTSIPYILEIHHVIGFPCAGSLSEWIGRWMTRLFLRVDARAARAVRCVSRGTANVLEKWGVSQDKLHVVPSFYLDTDLLQPDLALPKKYDVVFCGRFVANKGLKEVIEAIALLPHASLLVIGDGPLLSRLKSQISHLGVAGRVTFLGWISGNVEVYRAIQSAKMFVMNSKSEGGPRVALEAMALGMPVIATRVGVMPEVIEDGKNGMFTTGEAGDLAEKIRGLFSDDSLRQRIGIEARKVLHQFERKKLIKGYAEFLKSVASPSPLSPPSREGWPSGKTMKIPYRTSPLRERAG